MQLPRLLIPFTIQFSVRYVLRTGLLEALQNSFDVAIVLGWDDDLLRQELQGLGCQVYVSPKFRVNLKFGRLREKIHHAHFVQINSVSNRIDRDRRLLDLTWFERFRYLIKTSLYNVAGFWPGNFDRWIREEQQQIISGTNYSEYVDLIENINPDVLFSITPFFLDEELLLRAAKKKHVKLITSILSFDNLTTRPRIPVLFDRYLLWNNYNRQELLRIYPMVNPDDVEIVGVPQFDFYYDSSYLWDEPIWRDRLGISANRPVILFGAGPETITPVEPHIVAQLDEAIEQGQFPNKPIILLRLHPVDAPTRWESLRKIARHVIFDMPWRFGKEVAGKTNISRYDIEKLVSTLKYCKIHINTSSTMTIDGAIFGRPQIGPAYDDRPGGEFDHAMKKLYLREHYLPITDSGGLDIARSRSELIQSINNAFSNPERLRKERVEMIRKMCTFDDGQSTSRVVKSIKAFAENNNGE